MRFKVTIYFCNGASVEISAYSLDFTGDSLSFYEESGIFASFNKKDVAGWVMERNL